MSNKSLGIRALEIAKTQLWVRETPLGSNTGPEIIEYLDPCIRGDNNTRLNLRRGNWCSAFACYCHQQALLPWETEAHGYRAGVIELVADATRSDNVYSSIWYDIKSVKLGDYLPRQGDLAIYDRSRSNRPDTSWWRHVNRIDVWEGGTYTAIGGNENDKVLLSRHSLDNPQLLGIIGYPSPTLPYTMGSRSKPIISSEERKRILDLVAIGIDEMIRDKLYGA